MLLTESQYIKEGNYSALFEHVLNELVNEGLYQIPDTAEFSRLNEWLSNMVDADKLECQSFNGWNVYLPVINETNETMVLLENMETLNKMDEVKNKLTGMCETFKELRSNLAEADTFDDNDELNGLFSEINDYACKLENDNIEDDKKDKLLLDLNELADKMCAQLEEERKYAKMCEGELNEEQSSRKKRWYETTNSNYKRLGKRITKTFKSVVIPFGFAFMNGYNAGQSDSSGDSGGDAGGMVEISLYEQKMKHSIELMKKLSKKKGRR